MKMLPALRAPAALFSDKIRVVFVKAREFRWPNVVVADWTWGKAELEHILRPRHPSSHETAENRRLDHVFSEMIHHPGSNWWKKRSFVQFSDGMKIGGPNLRYLTDCLAQLSRFVLPSMCFNGRIACMAAPRNCPVQKLACWFFEEVGWASWWQQANTRRPGPTANQAIIFMQEANQQNNLPQSDRITA